MSPRLSTLCSAEDGFSFNVLHQAHRGARRGGVVILHEIFGLDPFMWVDANRYAAAGYEVLAPSLFDRDSAGFVGSRDEAGIAEAMSLMNAADTRCLMNDIAACVEALGDRGPTYVVGYCFGGRLAWQAAAELAGIRAAACYYGQIAGLVHLAPRCPVICHFGRNDTHIDAEYTRALISAAHPAVAFHIYDSSGHGFNNAGAAGSDPTDAILARERTLALFADCTD